MFHFTDSIILGIVEGLTEFLPVSSTAHLVLASRVLRLGQSDFLKTFEISIQSGAILAVVWRYWKSFWDMETLKRLIVAFIPTGILGLVFYKIIKNYLLGSTAVIMITLALGGLFLIIFEKYYTRHKQYSSEMKLQEISYGKCAALGLFQAIAMIPGVSRSAATIVGGLFMGIPRKTIVEFSFLLAVPTMLAATGLDILKSASGISSDQFSFLAVGFITSFFMAAISIRWFLGYIKKHDFIPFGVYRIILVILFLLFI
jgi:undecaprenyl-diphosphatase